MSVMQMYMYKYICICKYIEKYVCNKSVYIHIYLYTKCVYI